MRDCPQINPSTARCQVLFSYLRKFTTILAQELPVFACFFYRHHVDIGILNAIRRSPRPHL
jgi:hypothetical protein